MGRSYRPFIYDINWDQRLAQRAVTRYQNGEARVFDNRVMLRPGVGEYFLQLNGLLRPLIQRRWAAMVAQLNRLEESQLERFLFGADRIQTAKVRAGLWEIRKALFLLRCTNPSRARRARGSFVPWSRYPDDALDNFVVADKNCNGLKSNSLAAADHLVRWTQRLADGSEEYAQLATLARRTKWDRHPQRSFNVARAIYLRLPNDASLWLRGREFVSPDALAISNALKVR